jgi:tetratricopeptide (TPR) repeat protein
MREEINEFLEARTLVEQADAMIDLMYFAMGTMVEMGLRPEELFDIVHHANMSKLWSDGKPRFRPADGKIQKPENWVDPEPLLLKAIEKQSPQLPATPIAGFEVEEIPVPFSRPDLEKAFQIVDVGKHQKTPAGRRKMARRALTQSPYCTRAYLALAYDCTDIREKWELYTQGVKVSPIALGKEFLAQNMGRLFLYEESCPYMLALAGKASCAWKLGRRCEAIETYWKALEADAIDPQGNRTRLANCLLMENQLADCEELLKTWPDKGAITLYNTVLLRFKQNRLKEAKKVLKKAVARCSYIVDNLLSDSPQATPLLDYALPAFTEGDGSEAKMYQALSGQAWNETPEALEWLRAQASSFRKIAKMGDWNEVVPEPFDSDVPRLIMQGYSNRRSSLERSRRYKKDRTKKKKRRSRGHAGNYR